MSQRGLTSTFIALLAILTACTAENTGRPAADGQVAHSGFTSYDVDGEIWVVRTQSPEHARYRKDGPVDTAYKAIGEGPGGKNVLSYERDTVIEFLGTKPGFRTKMIDGSLWVWRADGGHEADILSGKLEATCFKAIGEGPLGVHLKSDSTATYLAWATAKPGFYTKAVGNEVWIARAGHEDAAKLRAGELTEKGSTFIGEGPGGRNLKGYDRDTLLAWEIAAPGFNTYLDEKENKIWVFLAGSAGEETYLETGPLGVHAALISEGPGGRTVCSDEMQVAKDYVATVN